MDISFLDYTDLVNKTAIALQENKETIPHEEAATAAAYIRDMAIKEPGDALIYCAALNLLNTYVKQKDSQIGYGFKNKLGYYLSIIDNAHIDNIIVDFQYDKGATLVITQVGHLQFSFHNVRRYESERLIEKSEKRVIQLEWDGIRKQQCASSLFKMSIHSPVGCTNLTYRGKNLTERVEKTVNNYNRGIVKIEEILFK